MDINEKEFNFTGDLLRCGASCPGVGNHSEYEIIALLFADHLGIL